MNSMVYCIAIKVRTIIKIVAAQEMLSKKENSKL